MIFIIFIEILIGGFILFIVVFIFGLKKLKKMYLFLYILIFLILVFKMLIFLVVNYLIVDFLFIYFVSGIELSL